MPPSSASSARRGRSGFRLRWSTGAWLAAVALAGLLWLWPAPVLHAMRHLLALTGSPVSDHPLPGDQAIVVLGGRNWRTEKAAQAAKATGLPVYLAGKELAPSLHRLGVKERWSESISFNTETNAAVAACLLLHSGIRQVTLVTDPWHMARATLWFRHFGFKVTQVAAPVPAAEAKGPEARRSQRHEIGGLAEFALLELVESRASCDAVRKWPKVAAVDAGG
ncbi:MAG: YdcF family protein [Burkholderiales bacterium]|nr:YdcF family protein [Burkholderiales bacterium]